MKYGENRAPRIFLLSSQARPLSYANQSDYANQSSQTGKTKRSQAVVPVVQAATRAIMLSGTPALSRPCDLYCQLDALQKGHFGTFHNYSLKFCDAKRR
eukprot:6045532-Pyramimonas_sp.AAC.1